MDNTRITVAHGDGIGPEIMEATLYILKEARAALDIETIEIGEKVYLAGNAAGIEPSAFDSLRRTKVFLKAPTTTPWGGGYKSLDVTLRRTFGLYANVRPCVSYYPVVPTNHEVMDVVIVRENEEDVYGGIEYRQTGQVTQCLKLISRPGTEKIVRCAFEYARANNRRKVTCFTNDSIMKITDGLFHRIFDEVAREYTDIENDHWSVGKGAAMLSDRPYLFDVVVLPNLYGDVLSDVAAQISGSVGLTGSVNIGESFAMFEAIHGSAPRRAGQNVANPSGLLLAAVMMLGHIGQPDKAALVHNAWLRTLEEGVHTYDIYRTLLSKVKVGTREFAEAVVERLGLQPQTLKAISDESWAKGGAQFAGRMARTASAARTASKQAVGVDVYLDWTDGTANDLGGVMERLNGEGLRLASIANRGVKVYPGEPTETFCSDHWRCRFVADAGEGTSVTHEQIARLLARAAAAELDFIKTENLYNFNGEPGYSHAQE